jgi:hypothetical protein
VTLARSLIYQGTLRHAFSRFHTLYFSSLTHRVPGCADRSWPDLLAALQKQSAASSSLKNPRVFVAPSPNDQLEPLANSVIVQRVDALCHDDDVEGSLRREKTDGLKKPQYTAKLL